jgi:phosphoribosylformylglycinamidine (FGAM) synthase-like enzyme
LVGLLDDHRRRLEPALRTDGDFVLVVGETGDDLGGSEYAKVLRGEVSGRPPALDLGREVAVQAFVLDAAGAGLLRSAHDVAEGGMLVAMVECCLLGGRGVHCGPLRPDGRVPLEAAFFGESQSRFVVSAASRAIPELQVLARRHRVELVLLGLAGGDAIEFEGQLRVPLADVREVWESALLAPHPPGG